MVNTNAELAKELNCTPRQISKSRRRGWIWHTNEGQAISHSKSVNSAMGVFKRKQYTAPPPRAANREKV